MTLSDGMFDVEIARYEAGGFSVWNEKVLKLSGLFIALGSVSVRQLLAFWVYVYMKVSWSAL